MTRVDVTLEVYGPDVAEKYVPIVRAIFAAVFAEPPYYEGATDVAQWLNDFAMQLTTPGFSLALARVDETAVGFTYGYTMTPDLPRWQKIVEPLAHALPPEAIRQQRLFTLMEFAVLADWRRYGIGRGLHDRLLQERSEPATILTVREDAAAAQAAYSAWGWRKIGHRPRREAPGYDVLVREIGVAQATQV